jgi:PAS domain S-box-containing protein
MKNDKKSGTQLVERTEPSRQYAVDLAKSEDEHKAKCKNVVQKSVTSYRSTLDAMLEGCQIIGFDWRYLYVNDAVVTHGHRTKEELLGHTMMEVYPGIENTEMFAELRRCMEKRTSHRMENEFTFPDGSKGWFDLSMEPVPQGILVLSRDITEPKQTEEALRESEEKYRTILEDVKVGYWETDLAGNFTSFNDTVCYLLGYSKKEMMGMNYRANTGAEDVAKVYKAFNQVYRTGTPIRNMHYEIVWKDGSKRFAETSVLPKQNDKGEIIGFRGISHDITERIQTEGALRRSEERYRTILDEIEEGYYEVDLAGNFIFVNKAACRQFGYTEEELTGMNYRVYVSKEDIKSVYKAWNKVYRTGEPLTLYPFASIRKDRTQIFLENSVSPLRNKEWKIIGFRSISRDVTERKKAEKEKMQLEQKAQVTSRLASVGEMTAGVAHEINNPLTGVIGYAQLLMERKDIPADIRRDLSAINDGAQHVAGIVKRLLTFSRQTKPERSYVDINELIESTLVLRAYHLRVNNIKVATRLSPDLPITMADPGQIQQVLLNLIVNAEMAMKLAHGKGKLTITTEKSDNRIKICCKDDGSGVKSEIMDSIFDPFFTTREVGEGTGLGLSLCYGIVTEHKGKIYAESKPGRGATFVVELPIVSKPQQPKPAEPVVKKPKKMGKARILVVDDEPVIRDFVNQVLASKGYEVETVDNADDALKKVQGKRYNLILLDVKMPGTDGIELYKRIQKITKSLARRVVFITGDVMGADTETFLAQIKAPCLDKPFDAEQLKREVKRALIRG